jgi:hypothetical protein
MSPRMKQSFLARLLLSVTCVVLATSLIHGDPSSTRQDKLNGGYYLFHHLCEDEDPLPLLLDIKHAPKDISTYADEISKTAKESLATLDRWHDRDPSLRFDKNPLPQIEQDVRDSIKAGKQHQLLFGTSNSEFVRALIVSQIEACTYATNLCKVLADQETDPDRAKSLRQMSLRWQGMRDEAFRILRDY